MAGIKLSLDNRRSLARYINQFIQRRGWSEAVARRAFSISKTQLARIRRGEVTSLAPNTLRVLSFSTNMSMGALLNNGVPPSIGERLRAAAEKRRKLKRSVPKRVADIIRDDTLEEVARIISEEVAKLIRQRKIR